MQGYAEARYHSEYGPTQRRTIMTAVLFGLMRDLFFCSHDVLYKRLMASANFGIFALLGYLAYRFPRLLELGVARACLARRVLKTAADRAAVFGAFAGSILPIGNGGAEQSVKEAADILGKERWKV